MRPSFAVFLLRMIFLSGCLCTAVALQAQESDAVRYPLIPYPVSVIPSGTDFAITKTTALVIEAPSGKLANEGAFLQQMLRRYLGQDALPAGSLHSLHSIVLRQDSSVKGAEGYRLSANGRGLVLSARTSAGMFYAIETLRQLLPSSVENGHGSSLSVSGVDIEDQPAFPWRGMMLDVSRHFFSTAYLKKYIDMMAMYKYNTLHLHLTDDQGWRIQIKKYPRLTDVSAWRAFNNQDSDCVRIAKETGNPDFNIDPAHIRYVNGQEEYGGFYTQEEMKDVIRYAASRHIQIVPEIDMPGHMMAAILLYPELTCDGKPAADFVHNFSTPICPCKESTLQFAKDIFSEIADLFPSPYIHIGGDEVEKSEWKKSALCQRFMQEHHIESLDKLQSYFNDYMQAFFHSRGKTLVGWDEIVEGGIDSSAMVMFWRPWAPQSPSKATGNGNKVIMSPDGPLYFDAWPDRQALSAVYHYNPWDTSYGMNAQQQQNIIGVQANLWTERVPTESRADYLTMPRLSALAELGWTHKDLYASYLQRLEVQYDRLDRLGIHYRLPDLPEVADNRVFIDTAFFMTSPPSAKLTVHYTTDGTYPLKTSPALSRPLSIDHTLTFRMAAFTVSGLRGDVQTIHFEHQSYAEAVTAPDLQPGLRCDLYRGDFNKTTDIKGPIDSTWILPNIGIPASIPSSSFGLRFRGYISVPETGVYSFFLGSNDGSVLHISDRLVVDNDGQHAEIHKGGQVALQKGLHPFALDFMDAGGGYFLGLTYSKEGETPKPVPDSWFMK